MDSQSAIIETATNHDIEARQRFESFKLGNGLPSTLKGHRHVHSRSHSRNLSISSTSSLSIIPPKYGPVSLEDTVQGVGGSAQAQALTPSSRRNSHHRRRSSVSTRHESAEMMGVFLPDLPASSSDDFGDKDSIRRRALWALEGKPDVSFSKVEIPELSNPQVEKFMSDLPVKHTFSTVSGLSNLLSNKRDSFKLLSSASSTKDQLHTLVEEEEEEEEVSSLLNSKQAAVATNPLPATSLHRKGQLYMKPAALRPTSLNLRPLSLTAEHFSSNSNHVSSSPRGTAAHRTGLKTLSLSLHKSADATAEQKCQSLNFSSSTDNPPSLNDDGKVRRRSSICYKTSSVVTINHAGLPTPATTPIHKERHFSLTSIAKDDECFPYDQTSSRPLSPSEQSFLVKSHHALLARISDLERALSAKGLTGSTCSWADTRPTSLASEFSITSDQTLGDPADEMLQLIADLKAERDEYKRDIDAWRQRVNDLENKLASMAKRVEAERRQAWIAQSRVGLIEIEKTSLEKQIGFHEATLNKIENEKRTLEHENQKWHEEIARALLELARANEQLEKAQQEIKAMKQSKAVRLPSTQDPSDEDDGLILYEESDTSFQTSSGDSIEELPETTPFFAFNTVGSRMLQSPNTPDTIKMHDHKHSLSTNWTFPVGAQMVAEPCNVESDKFFGCLESGDETSNGVTDPDEYNYERSKGLFSAALKAYKDDPDAALIGLAVESQSIHSSVAEQESKHDADEDMFGEASGICITLTPAQDYDNDDDDDVPETSTISLHVSSSEPPVLPPLSFGSIEYEAEETPRSVSIDFSRYDVSTPAKGSRSPTSKTASTKSTSPSSIPRLKSCFKTGSSSSPAEHTPCYFQVPCSTPPMECAIPFPSFIPQAIYSPSPIRIANVYPHPHFSSLTRPSQPQRQSTTLLSSQQGFPKIKNENHCGQVLEESFNSFSPTPFTTSTERHASSPSLTGKCIISNPRLPPKSLNPPTDKCQLLLSSPKSVSPRVSLQKLTNLIPSWAPRLFGPRSKSVQTHLHDL